MTVSRRILIFAALLGVAPFAVQPAQAGNSRVEATLQSFGDLSMFYQAMLNSGLINELSENGHYTIFAPTNAAFAQLSQDSYPCFYAPQCRPQIAALLRGHIIEGNYDAPKMVTYGQGLRTLGGTVAHIREPYVNDFTVDNHTVLSKSEAGGNTIYRIDGVIADQQALNQFRTVPYEPTYSGVTAIPPVKTVTTRKTITTYDPSLPVTAAYPAGSMVNPSINGRPENLTETTTVITGYTTTTGDVQ